MAKQEDHLAKIKKLIGKKELIIGSERTIKELKNGNLKVVYFSKNVEKKTREEIEYLSGLSNTEIIELDKTNEELGIICKKQFFISVLSVKQ